MGHILTLGHKLATSVKELKPMALAYEPTSAPHTGTDGR